jgi:hypothetical protein
MYGYYVCVYIGSSRLETYGLSASMHGNRSPGIYVIIYKHDYDEGGQHGTKRRMTALSRNILRSCFNIRNSYTYRETFAIYFLNFSGA